MITPVRMAITKKTRENKHWQGCGDRGRQLSNLPASMGGRSLIYLYYNFCIIPWPQNAKQLFSQIHH